ncbi:hypothetical protein HMN09_01385800 [Mycena chlorophos]|uniref:Helicase ATP-binding domain-containing protein n=1 Tax=Mycena chlorophos TaxID=658473 RepID=A0A8H6RYE8_MYCCL|nr:hypothetical protein HMN09_01385800 [Mycena chlorophos]
MLAASIVVASKTRDGSRLRHHYHFPDPCAGTTTSGLRSVSMGHDIKQVNETLAHLRDYPVDTAATSDSQLSLLYTYLRDVPAKAGRTHWFCHRAESTTIEAATFLLRLHAYNSSTVLEWRAKLQGCLKGCVDCVAGLQQAKVASRRTYFAAFAPSVIDNFFSNLDEWETSHVLQNIIGGSFASSPSPVVYHAFANPVILEDSRVMAILLQQPPLDVFSSWPSDPLAPGLLLLFINQDARVRKWVALQASQATVVVPTPPEKFSAAHATVLERFTTFLDLDAPRHFSVSSDPRVLWSALGAILKFIPESQLDQIYLQVLGHLHDTGPQFTHILDCFKSLTTTLGSRFWRKQPADYPKVVFDSIKDNASLAELLLQATPPSPDHPTLSWCSVFLTAIHDHPTQAEIVARFADFLCEELQHERFGAARPAIMFTAIKTFTKLLRTDGLRLEISKVLDIHANAVLAVAFSASHSAAMWLQARDAALRFIKQVMTADIDALLGHIATAFKTAKQIQKTSAVYDNPEPRLVGGPRIWQGLYKSLVPGNDVGVALVFEVLARAAHLDYLAPQFFKLAKTEDLAVNRCLTALWDGLSDGLARYTQNSRTQTALEFLRRPGAAQHVFTLLFSPREDIQLSAESLVGLAFDVDGRQDCYRVLLQKYTDAAFEALLGVLTRFNDHVEGATEACSLGKHVVCYLQDLTEVMFSRQGGLMHNPSLLQVEDADALYAQLPELWLRLNQALSLLFKHAPSWAAKFDPEDMVIWMRDALLLGREVFSHFPSFRALSTRRVNAVSPKFVDGLQIVLPELAVWLRLTDEELLHQMFELLAFLFKVFTEAHAKPKPTTMAKLQKYIDLASDSRRSRLDASRLLRLENDLAAFADPPQALQPRKTSSSRAPEIIEVQIPPAHSKSRKSDAARRPYIQSSSSSSSPRLSTLRRPSDVPSASRRSAPTPSVSTRLPSEAPSASSSRRPSEARSVSSAAPDDSSSSDDEPGVGGKDALASLSHMQRSPKISKNRTKPTRQVQFYDGPMAPNPVQERLERRAQEARRKQRMMPDTSELYKTVVSWDFKHTGARPPGSSPDMVGVPSEYFVDYEHYYRVFFPLLLVECWGQIVQAKAEPRTAYPFKVGSRSFVDDWIVVDLSLEHSVEKDWRLTDQDIVLLQRGDATIMAKVESYKTLPGKATIDVVARFLARLDPGVALNTEWHLSSVFNLSTSTREYSALLGLRYYDICPSILRPAPPPVRAPNKELVQKVMTRHRVNQPQATAIASCLENPGFSLIQGPPGTGKTSTIVALVKSHIERRARRITAPTKNNKNAKSDAPEPQILICAPSNAAVDEIAQRIRDSDVFKNEGKSVVRLGPIKAMNPNLVDVSLEHMMDQKLETGKDTGLVAEMTALRTEIESVKTLRRQKLDEMDAITDNLVRVGVLQDEIARLNFRRTSLSKKLDELRDNRTKMARGLDSRRRALRQEILQGAHVICATLSTSGSDYLQDLEIDMVIIDEASQAVEPSALIPLKYQPNHTVLVGDPQQLPPTVISDEARRFQYNQSLFVRLQKTWSGAMHLLSIQYRMHPSISLLPSKLFYQSRITDGPDMERKTAQPWHLNLKFGVYRFMNVKSVEDNTGRSLKNLTECRMAVALFSRLRKSFPSIDFDGKVGVISMYRAQILELKRAFIVAFGNDITQTVDFNTVDGFQGQEKSIIILSCVRAGPGQEKIGFVADIRRMNVALTRAKSSLFVLGNAPTLSRSDDVWKNIIADAQARDAFVDVNETYFSEPDRAPVRVTSSPVKVKAEPTVVAIPADLVTPREFKKSLEQRSAGHVQPMASGSKPPPMATSAPPLKRKAEETEQGSAAKKLNAQDPPPTLSTVQPAPPPSGINLKRHLEPEDARPTKKPNFKPKPPKPKDAAASLFIPKKVQRK